MYLNKFSITSTKDLIPSNKIIGDNTLEIFSGIHEFVNINCFKFKENYVKLFNPFF